MGDPIRVSELPARVARDLRRGVAIDVISRGKRVATIVPSASSKAEVTLSVELAAWRARHEELPDDPFSEDHRMHSPAREVDW